MKILNWQKMKLGGLALGGVISAGKVFACACGCGVFDVGTSSMLPTGPGGMAYLDYNYEDQNQNWNGTSSAPAADNNDRKIETHFVTLGLQYMFNRRWGVKAEVPYAFRNYKAVDDDGNLINQRWNTLGDIRIEGIYTGFSADLSSGLTFGLKLPTGSFNHDADVIDRDTQVGTGSTDFLVGGFHRIRLGKSHWNCFGQVELDVPALVQDGYRPGIEGNAAVGIYRDGIMLGGVEFTPIAQVIGTWRGRDDGIAADPENTGYQRLMISPGIEAHYHSVKIYGGVEFPIYENTTGNQLVAPVLVKVSLSFMF
jgi:hypothetical protein